MTVVSLLAASSGCPDRKEPLPQKPFSGAQVRIGVPAGLGFRAAWETALNEWSAQTGAAVELHEYSDADALFPLSSEALERNTLVLLPIDRIADAESGTGLAAIPDSHLSDENLNWLDLFQGLRDNVASWQQKPVLIPVSAPVLACYYRSDLLKRAGLKPPRTWDEYQNLLDKLNDWAPGLAAVEPWSREFRATMFLARAVSFAKHPGHFSLFFDIETGEPLIASPGFVKGLETTKAALAKMPADVLTLSPADCRARILSGKAALAISFETGPGNPEICFGPGFRDLQKNDASKEAKQEAAVPSPAHGASLNRSGEISLGFVPLPGSNEVYNPTRQEWEGLAGKGINQVTLTAFGGLAATVSAKAQAVDAEAAWNLIGILAGDQTVANFSPATRSLCRESQCASPAAWVGSELNASEASAYVGTSATSLNNVRLVGELPVIGRGNYRRDLTEGMTKVLEGGEKPESALREVAEKWKQHSKKTGINKVRDNYRGALGLGPVVH